MKIYTKAGDLGETSLWGRAGEKRVRKDALRVEAYGTVDEANAALGVAYAELAPGILAEQLRAIQHRLFALGADLSNISAERQDRVRSEDIETLERWIDGMESRLSPLRQFILPGGTKAASFLHVARTLVRRAERRVVALTQEDSTLAVHVKYLNRLSDYLFVAARMANRLAGQEDEPARF